MWNNAVVQFQIQHLLDKRLFFFFLFQLSWKLVTKQKHWVKFVFLWEQVSKSSSFKGALFSLHIQKLSWHIITLGWNRHIELIATLWLENPSSQVSEYYEFQSLWIRTTRRQRWHISQQTLVSFQQPDVLRSYCLLKHLRMFKSQSTIPLKPFLGCWQDTKKEKKNNN